MKRALLLTGGGARGAYQAGVLAELSDMLGSAPRPLPFPILTGMSAGGLNLMTLATRADDFAAATRKLEALWAEITLEQVFQTDFFRVTKTALRWLRNLTFGGQLGYDPFSGLLNPKPLRTLLEGIIDFPGLRRELAAGRVESLALLATHYASGAAVAFVEANHEVQPWARGRRLGIPVQLAMEHIMASAAIPMIFPPVKVGNGYYGDGSIRMSAPFSPAIHLGADSVLAISVRKLQPPEYFLNSLVVEAPRPSIGAIAGGLLNSIFMDALDGDYERLIRINKTIEKIPAEIRAADSSLKTVKAMVLAPTEDLGSLSRPHLVNFPTQIRYLLKGIGADKPGSSDFLSYICFDKHYCRELLALGRADARARKDELLDFVAL